MPSSCDGIHCRREYFDGPLISLSGGHFEPADDARRAMPRHADARYLFTMIATAGRLGFSSSWATPALPPIQTFPLDIALIGAALPAIAGIRRLAALTFHGQRDGSWADTATTFMAASYDYIRVANIKSRASLIFTR